MRGTRIFAAVIFVGAVVLGSITDHQIPAAPAATSVLAADFHVHGMPGDGALPVWELQREAARRGLDVIAVTNHDDNLSYRLAQTTGLLKPYPVVIPGQEVTAPGYHMTAIGIRSMVSSAVPAARAIAAIHAQGGVAIAAHPIRRSWVDSDDEALRTLDGVEMSHPLLIVRPDRAAELLDFFERTRSVNSDVAPIGSTDFHAGMPLGTCRTYLIVDEPTETGVLDAIRRGRTVAAGPGDRLIGADEHIAVVRNHLKAPGPANLHGRPAWTAAIAALALAVFVLTDRRRES